ncbi:hypothetical protein Tco_0686239 [Tanacetum coccineum]
MRNCLHYRKDCPYSSSEWVKILEVLGERPEKKDLRSLGVVSRLIDKKLDDIRCCSRLPWLLESSHPVSLQNMLELSNQFKETSREGFYYRQVTHHWGRTVHFIGQEEDGTAMRSVLTSVPRIDNHAGLRDGIPMILASLLLNLVVVLQMRKIIPPMTWNWVAVGCSLLKSGDIYLYADEECDIYTDSYKSLQYILDQKDLDMRHGGGSS